MAVMMIVNIAIARGTTVCCQQTHVINLPSSSYLSILTTLKHTKLCRSDYCLVANILLATVALMMIVGADALWKCVKAANELTNKT